MKKMRVTPLAENEEKNSEETSTKLTPKVMASAVYTFMLLDFQKRWNRPKRFDKTMSKTIINNLPTLKECFEKHTASIHVQNQVVHTPTRP